MDNKQEFLSKLADTNIREFDFYESSDNRNKRRIIKSAYSPDIDFVYAADHTLNNAPYRIGVYFHSKSIFCFAHWFYKIMEADGMSEAELEERMTNDVNKAIADNVSGKPVPVTDHAQDFRDDNERERKYYMEYRAEERAKEHFFEGTEPSYQPDCRKDDTFRYGYGTKCILEYIKNPMLVVERLANEYIIRNAKKINYILWAIEQDKKALEKIKNTPGVLHIQKAIADAVSAIDAKMVNIIISKNGVEMSGKIKADTLKHGAYNSYHSAYNLDAPSRREFERLYGRSNNILPEDIWQITYRQKTIYQKKED